MVGNHVLGKEIEALIGQSGSRMPSACMGNAGCCHHVRFVEGVGGGHNIRW